jgi:hypothetical protein
MKSKCEYCKKKINVTNSFECDCSNKYCHIHRFPETHNCQQIHIKKEKELKQLQDCLVKVDFEKISII